MFVSTIQPQFFDIFGIIVFMYISVLSFLLIKGKKMPRWSFFILFIIGLAGLIIDGAIVYLFYLDGFLQ